MLHPHRYIRHNEQRERVLLVQRGNVKADIEITYEFGITKGKQKKAPPLIIDGKAHLPVQLQMEYTAVDGARFMRVFTKAMPVTNDRHTAEKSMFVGS